MLSAHCTAGKTLTHSEFARRWIERRERSTSFTVRWHVPLDHGECATANGWSTRKASRTRVKMAFLKCVAVSLTYTRGTRKVLHHANKDAAVASALRTSTGSINTKLLRSSMITKMYRKPLSSDKP